MLPGIKLWDVVRLFEKLSITDLEPIFIHSLDVAKLSAAMAQLVGLNPTEAYIGGLFHDIGVAVYTRFVKKEVGCRDDVANGVRINWGRIAFDFASLVEDIDKDNTHSLLSYLMLKQLRLVPDYVLEGVLYHHSCTAPELTSKSRQLAQILCVADGISQTFRKYVSECPSLSYEQVRRFLEVQGQKGIEEEIVEKASVIVDSEFLMSYIFDRFGYPGRFSIKNININFDSIIDLFRIIVILTDMRSEFTRNHSMHIALLARDLGLEILHTERDAESLYLAGLIHDVGKMRIPLNILHKPGKLTTAEMLLMRTHVVETFKMLEGLSGINEVVRIAVAHHERLDGSGYPFGLSAREIPVKARILQVADVFVALTENRPYRRGMDYMSALNILWTLASEGKLDGHVIGILDSLIHEDYIIEIGKDPINTLFSFSRENELVSYVKKEVLGV